MAQVEELLGGLLIQRVHWQYGQGGGVEARGYVGAQADDEPDGAAGEPASHESAHLGAGGVQPLAVVEHEEQGFVRRGEREQVEHGDAEGHDRGGCALIPAEDDVEHSPVHVVQAIDVGQQRVQELVQTGERELRLGLDPGRADHPVVLAGRQLGGMVQQGALADARLAPQHKSLASRGRHELVQHVLFACAAEHGPDDGLHTSPTVFPVEAQERGYVAPPHHGCAAGVRPVTCGCGAVSWWKRGSVVTCRRLPPTSHLGPHTRRVDVSGDLVTRFGRKGSCCSHFPGCVRAPTRGSTHVLWDPDHPAVTMAGRRKGSHFTRRHT